MHKYFNYLQKCPCSPADLRHIFGEPGFGLHTKSIDGF